MNRSEDDVTIVIGSGPCGATAAAQLVSRGVRVVMLDAGDHPPRGLVVKAGGNTVYRRFSYKEMSTDRHSSLSSDDVEWYSSLSLGGLSNYWTAAVPRFAPGDFFEGARLDERYRWPITYEDLVPYYKAVEEVVSVTAGDAATPGVPPNVAHHVHRQPLEWRELIGAANEAGHGVGVLPMAHGKPWMIARRATEFSSFHCIVAPLMQHPGFELRRASRAVRLNWDTATGQVESVDYLDSARRQRRNVRARAVVIAAGAIDSTLLLLQSTSSDFPEGLGNTAGLVGRYLHDHPREWWVARTDRSVPALAHPVYVARRPHEQSDPLMATSLTIGLARTAHRLKTFHRGRVRQVGVQVFGTMIPKPDVGVLLQEEVTDGDGLGRPILSLTFDDQSLTNLAAARDRMSEVFTAGGIDFHPEGPFYHANPGSSVHFGGTARMHQSPEFGVVDAVNRIFDVPNVVICDSSCFTTGPEKNPTLTAMAIAARAADRLADDLHAGTLG